MSAELIEAVMETAGADGDARSVDHIRITTDPVWGVCYRIVVDGGLHVGVAEDDGRYARWRKDGEEIVPDAPLLGFEASARVDASPTLTLVDGDGARAVFEAGEIVIVSGDTRMVLRMGGSSVRHKKATIAPLRWHSLNVKAELGEIIQAATGMHCI